jgi:RNA polymerase-associated protein LEO1
MSSPEDDVMNTEPEADDDLFGDEAEDGPEVEARRELSDEELDSGDDENRQDRAPKTGYEDEEPSHELRISEQTVWRHPLPRPVDGEVRLSTHSRFTFFLTMFKFNALRLPKFLGIDPRAFTPDSFKIPTRDHHSEHRSANFSASATASTTMRYRKDLSTGKLESNTLVYRWSDGSTTLAVGDQHYELQTKPLAPPKDAKPYKEVEDSHSYVATPSMAAQLLVVFGHMTNQYVVRPNKDIEDDALEKLQRSLAAAARGNSKGDNKNGPELITNTIDPELQKKRAEIAEKERMKAQRRRETAAEKASLPSSGRGRSGGLTVDDLEGRSGRRAPAGRKAGGVKRPRRRPEYDSDDDLPQGRAREDEYDKDDGFLASSDEELEEGEGEDDEEELLDDESDDEPKAKKQKPSRPEENSDADADAEADLDDDEALAPLVTNEAPSGRGRKRNVIEDDEDE